MKKPRRLFRTRPAEPSPPIPPEVERLRKARDVIDPDRDYEIQMPDGTVMTFSGRSLLESARLLIALADAQKAGDEEAMRTVLENIAEES